MGCWTPPFGNPQVLAGAADPAELLAACAAGASVPLGKAASAYALATAPHLHRFGLGAYAPLPPAFPVRERLPVMHVWGAYAPLPPRSPLGNVCRSCANAHGTASETACGQRLRKSNAEAPAAQRRGVPSLPSRGCAEGTLARPQRGNPKGGAALFGQSLPTFCWPESRGPARPERVEGKNYNFK